MKQGTTYAIGIYRGDRCLGFSDGPSQMVTKMLQQVPFEENSFICELTSGQVKRIYRWSEVMDAWEQFKE